MHNGGVESPCQLHISRLRRRHDPASEGVGRGGILRNLLGGTGLRCTVRIPSRLFGWVHTSVEDSGGVIR